MNEIDLNFSGFTCDACAKLVSNRLLRIKGVEQAIVNRSGKAQLRANRTLTADDIKPVLNGTSYSFVFAQ
ncbi:hypothetical protein AUK40_00430 [Candidatus Wirthbacteria bacterium CG2_30_54_11]|uniref:Uncharacterized protein n=1 Tax=Candidatus Wirthbacteria bacterium CG2_30_54_11 TaxID=1817892 RepID=A0A1J5J5H4_9BACT|nr:MAG: hypothetical protein AUK40_00430 [Candidatus Wirthbacteria bacterium CG2_30_54_11]